MSDNYAFWLRSMAGDDSVFANPLDPDVDTQKLAGYWRKSGPRTGYDDPVAIATAAEDESVMTWQVGKQRPKNTVEHRDDWLRFLDMGAGKMVAVKGIDYESALTTGFWPDGKASKQMSDAAKKGIEIPEGDNAPPKDEALADQIKALAEVLEKAVEPTTPEEAVALSEKIERMQTLINLAKVEFEKEYRPHKSEADRISAKWKAIGTPGTSALDLAKDRKSAWLKKEQRRLDAIAEEENRRRAAVAEAERKRIAAETAARLRAEQEARAKEIAESGASPAEVKEQVADDSAIQAEAERQAAEAVAPVEKVEAQRATAGSTFGRSTGLRKVTVGEITDALAFATYLVNAEDEDIMTALKKRAKQLAKAKVPGVPGVQFGTEEK